VTRAALLLMRGEQRQRRDRDPHSSVSRDAIADSVRQLLVEAWTIAVLCQRGRRARRVVERRGAAALLLPFGIPSRNRAWRGRLHQSAAGVDGHWLR
jgi:hypothetical protein